MVIEIAKVFIPLSTQYEINIFPVSEIHSPPPLLYNLAMPTATENVSNSEPTNHCFIRNCTESNVKNITLLFFFRMKCPITYKKNYLEFATIC